MSVLRLPDKFIPLLMKIEPLLSIADQFSLGEQVEIEVSDGDSIVLTGSQIQTSIMFDNRALPKKEHLVIQDSWIAPYPKIDTLIAKVEENPNLIISSFPLSNEDIVDIWFSGGQLRMLKSHPTCRTEDHRAMLLTALALSFSLDDSLVLARAFSNNIAHSNSDEIKKVSWPVNLELFPKSFYNKSDSTLNQLHQIAEETCAFPSLLEPNIGLNPVVSSLEELEAFFKLGVKTVQFKPESESVEQKIVAAVELSEEYQAFLFICDHWQLALKHNAYGVHLHQKDLDSVDLLQVKQAAVRLGISINGYFGVIEALPLRPSYIALKHRFSTAETDPEGINHLALYRQLVKTTPTLAIGGINLENADRIFRTGVVGFTIEHALKESKDLKQTVAAFNAIMA
ncbi:thiamine phosphate synthase [Vibrio sp. SS-MA-C1-2]|uniref:thiamine phosphate synthase n=1 Tax=Vibrio sp. SS-MA-C1-2 TaxID=2908646 RepID=UPI001F3657D5|nr:thiamine phosphate synthase [Vibrio sp. SS-MA-C1-2]UJF19366.1 thiamine phosphate synthase [Vibrio sp. SS-MA-C1-2]